jgi:hypothetical protein
MTPDGTGSRIGLVDDRPSKMLPILWVTLSFVPQIACLAAGAWMFAAGQTVLGAALVAAAIAIEVAERLWARTLRRWLRGVN